MNFEPANCNGAARVDHFSRSFDDEDTTTTYPRLSIVSFRTTGDDFVRPFRRRFFLPTFLVLVCGGLGDFAGFFALTGKFDLSAFSPFFLCARGNP